MRVEPIGTIRTPYKNREDVPDRALRRKAVGTIKILRKYRDGLQDIEGFSHIILIWRFHRSRGYRLKLVPWRESRLRGVFATRSPRRPNQLGLTIVRLLKRQGNLLKVAGVDMIDRTPLLDIKPYVPDKDLSRGVRIGWLQGKK